MTRINVTYSGHHRLHLILIVITTTSSGLASILSLYATCNTRKTMQWWWWEHLHSPSNNKLSLMRWMWYLLEQKCLSRALECCYWWWFRHDNIILSQTDCTLLKAYNYNNTNAVTLIQLVIRSDNMVQPQMNKDRFKNISNLNTGRIVQSLHRQSLDTVLGEDRCDRMYKHTMVSSMIMMNHVRHKVLILLTP